MKADLLFRLESLESLNKIGRSELDWLVKHGKYEIYQPGLIFTKGTTARYLWIILTGKLSLHVDSGAGPKVANTELTSGSVTGVLPYSRLKVIPGDMYADERTELLSISIEHIPEMITKCPLFTTHTVHMMIDRTRIYNTSAMQDEKMISLGRISAGLAHELNNPASVVIRNIKLLRECQIEAANTEHSLLEAGLHKKQFRLIRDFLSEQIEKSTNTSMTSLQKSDIEDTITDWLGKKQIDSMHAAQLAELVINTEDLDKLLNALPVNIFQFALNHIVTAHRINKLTFEIEQSATKIHRLVEAAKEFTSMDSLAERELVDIESGINNTLKILDSKITSKSAQIIIEINKNVPRVYGNGAALNQVWFNLLENALDAIPISGKIRICAGLKTGQIHISFIDNGPGISSEKISRIFDPFYTTKPPGQGIGLGLDLSRRIIRRHKGDIYVRSGEGKTEFCVSLMLNKS